jgi:hypothetical protein
MGAAPGSHVPRVQHSFSKAGDKAGKLAFDLTAAQRIAEQFWMDDALGLEQYVSQTVTIRIKN